MKICWDTLDKIYLTKSGNFRIKGTRDIFVEKSSCHNCKNPYLTDKYDDGEYCSYKCMHHCKDHIRNRTKHLKGRKLTQTHKNKISKSNKGKKRSKKIIERISGKNSSNWKGGYHQQNIPMFDTYAHQISFDEEVRRLFEDENILEVKCTYCGKWFIPSLYDVRHRLQVLKGIRSGESRLYCSEQCKQECSIYDQNKYPKGFKPASSREVAPELRQMRFEIDDWTCQRCENHLDDLDCGLHCHHIDPVSQKPLLQNDLDSCITLCKECHKWVHSQDGCKYFELRCKKLE